jgi:hypothetical protein
MQIFLLQRQKITALIIFIITIVSFIGSNVIPVYAYAPDSSTTQSSTTPDTGAPSSSEEGEGGLDLINPERPPFIVRLGSQVMQWMIMGILRLAGLKAPDELFYNIPRGATTTDATAFGVFNDQQGVLILALMAVITAMCVPWLTAILQLKIISLGSSKNPNARVKALEGITRFVLIAIGIAGTAFFIAFFMNLWNVWAEGWLNLAIASGIETRPEALSLANSGKDLTSTYLNGMINVAGGLFTTLVILFMMVYFNFYYGMRFFNLFFMIIVAPIFVVFLSTDRFRGIGENFFKELVASIIVMPVHAVTWTLASFVMNYAGFGSTFSPMMTFIAYCAMIPQSDIIRGIIIQNDNSSKMARAFAGMGLNMASTFAMMSKVNEFRGARSSVGNGLVSGASQAGPEGLEPMGEGKTIPFAATTSVATQKVEGYRNAALKFGSIYGGISGALAGMTVPGAAPIGAYLGGKMGSMTVGGAGSLMGYGATTLGQNSLQEVKDLKLSSSELNSTKGRLRAVDNKLSRFEEEGVMIGTDNKDSGYIGDLNLERSELSQRVEELQLQNKEKAQLAQDARGAYWGVDQSVLPEEKGQAIGIQKKLNLDLATRSSNKNIPNIYQKANEKMNRITMSPPVSLRKGDVLFDEVVGNKMRTYVVKNGGQRQFYKEDYYSGKPAITPQYRVRQVLDPQDLGASIVHTKTDLSGYDKRDLQKMDYNTSGFVQQKEVAMRSLRNEVHKIEPAEHEHVSGNFKSPVPREQPLQVPQTEPILENS